MTKWITGNLYLRFTFENNRTSSRIFMICIWPDVQFLKHVILAFRTRSIDLNNLKPFSTLLRWQNTTLWFIITIDKWFKALKWLIFPTFLPVLDLSVCYIQGLKNFASEEFLSWALEWQFKHFKIIFSNYKRKNQKMTTLCIIPQIFGSEFHNAKTA